MTPLHQAFILQIQFNSQSLRMSSFQIYNSPQSERRNVTQPHPSHSPPHQSPMRHSPPSHQQQYDFDFYRRKSDRLEEDLLAISDELNKARLRLRRAEDFQIKFDLLLKQKSTLEDDIRKKDKQLFAMRAKQEQLQLALQDLKDQQEDVSLQKMGLIRDAQAWKYKYLDIEQKLRLISSEEQNRAAEVIQKQILSIKKNYAHAQEQYKLQISMLTRQLHEKVSVEGSTFDKQERVKRQKQNEINRLEVIIQKNRKEYMEMVQNKNKEIETINNKFQAIFSQEMHQLKNNMSTQDRRFLSQLQGLKSILQLKNQQIEKLQQELKANLSNYISEREASNAEIKLLKEKIYERQRQNQGELYNMKERLINLHTIDIQTMQQHYSKLIEDLKNERQEMEKILREKDEKVQFQLKQFERGKQELRNIITSRQATIEELKKSQSKFGESNNKEINNLHEVLNKLTSEKQILGNEYQSNAIFLNQQITKLTTSNQLKNNEIRELHQYNALLKKEHFESLKDLENKWKLQRKQREIQRERQRDARQKIQEQYRQKQKGWKNKERQLERDCQKERRQKNKWIFNNQKLQKELQRILRENEQLEGRYKISQTSNQKITIQTSDSKRLLANELQKQKNDLQLKKRLEVDQIKKEYQLQITRLEHQNQKLQNECASNRNDIQKLQEELRKLSNQYKNVQKLNKEKQVDYNKKMATLNSEILLTQNLYQNFIDAKSRVVKKERQ